MREVPWPESLTGRLLLRRRHVAGLSHRAAASCHRPGRCATPLRHPAIRPTPSPMSDPFFFGYGSLVNRNTHAYPDARPAQLRGWHRLWVRIQGAAHVFLSVLPEEGTAVINIDESAQNQIIQILGANDTCGDAEAVRVGQALVNASTLLLQLEVSVDLSLKVAKEAFEQGKTVILDPGPVRHIPSEFFAYCSVITPNETEAQALVGFPVVDRTSAAQAAEQLLARGVGIAVVKLGAQGVYFANADGGDFVTPFQVDAIDSVAAGDAFNGALAVSLAEGATLEQSVRMAAAAGALAVTKSGAQDSMPYRKEVEGLLG